MRTKWNGIGFASGLTALFLFSLVQQAVRPAWVAHFVVLGFLSAAAAIAIWLRQVRRNRRADIAAGLAPPLGFAVGCALACVLSLAASVWFAVLVAQRAQAVAGPAPFCIQVASRGGYEAARTWLDLSGLTLWADGSNSVRVQNHAVLIVGDGADRRLFHWSYRQRLFLPGAHNERAPDLAPPLHCDPQRGFIARLSAIFPRRGDGLFVRFTKDEAYRIPESYQPIARGSPTPHLILAVTPPDFAPLERSWSALPPAEKDRHWVVIDLNPSALESFLIRAGNETVARGAEYGLQKEAITVHGRDGQTYHPIRYLLRARGAPDGAIETLISCAQATERFPASCQHRFLNGGRQFYFRHGPEQVPRWRDMQKSLVDLLASFEVQHEDAASR